MSKLLNRIAPQDEVLLETDIGRQVPSVAQVDTAIAEERRNRFTADTEIRLRVKALEEAAGDGTSGYALVELESTNGSFDPIFNVQNRAMNLAAASHNWPTVTLNMPPPVDGIARDFILMLWNCVDGHTLIVSGEGDPLLLPRDGDDSHLVPEEGTNIFAFTEIKPNTILASRTKVVEA